MAKSKNTYVNTEAVMEDYGILITDQIVSLLARYKKNATHKLSNSIDFDIVKKKGDIQLIVDYIDYGPKYRNKKTGNLEGNVLRGRKAGQKQPPTYLIVKWLRDKKIPMKVVKGSKSSKAKSNKAQVKTIAYLIARSIARNGIPAFNFLKPYDDIVNSKQYKKDLRDALLKDGYKSLQKPISDFNNAQLKKT